MEGDVASVLRSRGGIRQQVLVGQHLERGHASSHLADRLLQLWSWGLLSSPAVQWLAEGCVLDQGVSDQTRVLASIGHSGQYPGNCRRDLLVTARIKSPLWQPIPLIAPLLDNGKIQLSDQ
eukprot:6924261-Alexandrium_andersonii.AAC.1